MEKSVYHFRPKGMVGETLMPLNALKSVLPEVYGQQVKKYDGRKNLLERMIPILNCLWNDVLHFSPINPQIVIDTWRREGWYDHAKPPASLEVYRVPVHLLKNETTICFQSYNFDFDNYDPNLDKYSTFDSRDFLEQVLVEPEQLQAWRNDFNTGRRFLWYSHTKHILAKQEVDVRQCELIVCQ